MSQTRYHSRLLWLIKDVRLSPLAGGTLIPATSYNLEDETSITALPYLMYLKLYSIESSHVQRPSREHFIYNFALCAKHAKGEAGCF